MVGGIPMKRADERQYLSILIGFGIMCSLLTWAVFGS